MTQSTDYDAGLPATTPMGSGYPVAPNSGDECNTIHIATLRLEIWLLDHAGQRMGADPDSDDPVDQMRGTLYQLVLESGETRFNHASAEGLLVEYDVEASRSATLRWGEPEDKLRPEGGASDEEWANYFLYEEELALELAPWEDGGEAARHLANMGYGGEDDPRASFGADYGGSGDGTIADVHHNGTPRPSGGGDSAS